jgi:membrane-associated phospholipid phosphatase
MTNSNKSNSNNIIYSLDYYDKIYSDRIHCLELPPAYEKFVYLLARLFNPDFIISYLLLILIYKYFIFQDLFFVLKPLTHTILCLIITLYLKKLIARQRPLHKINVKRLFDLRKNEKNCSMPSGDSLQCANFAMIILCYFNINLGLFLIPCVMFSRIFYFCHYILDTIVGALLGLFLSYNIYIFLN